MVRTALRFRESRRSTSIELSVRVLGWVLGPPRRDGAAPGKKQEPAEEHPCARRARESQTGLAPPTVNSGAMTATKAVAGGWGTRMIQRREHGYLEVTATARMRQDRILHHATARGRRGSESPVSHRKHARTSAAGPPLIRACDPSGTQPGPRRIEPPPRRLWARRSIGMTCTSGYRTPPHVVVT
jgi:hypothetical protein